MAKLVLSGGSEADEIALISADALPARSPDRAAIADLEARDLLLRLPTGTDSAYLLHVFVDEPVPGDLLRYCDTAGVLRGRLQLARGGLAFGGLTSLFTGREPDDVLRSDAVIAPGRYEVLAYCTKFPDALVKRAIEAKLGKHAQRHVKALLQIIVTGLAFAGVALLLRAWFVAAVIALAAAFCVRLFLRHPRTKELHAMTREVERDYPGVVVALRSTSDPPGAQGR